MDKGDRMKKNNYRLIIDTREQCPLWTTGVLRTKLDVGDYSIEVDGKNLSNEISIERKSLTDLFGTLGHGHKRFKAELERALKLKYFAIVIDGGYTCCINKDFEKSYLLKMRGYVITSILFTIHVKYKIPIFFTQGRTESKRVIKEIFNAYYKIKNGS